jgi:hypothetical protein
MAHTIQRRGWAAGREDVVAATRYEKPAGSKENFLIVTCKGGLRETGELLDGF